MPERRPRPAEKKRIRELEARLAVTLDQLLREHAEWSRLRADQAAQPAGAATKAPPKPRATRKRAPKAEAPAKAPPARAPKPAPLPAPKPKAAPRKPKKRPLTKADRIRMRRLKEAQQRAEKMGLKPWRPKKAPQSRPSSTRQTAPAPSPTSVQATAARARPSRPDSA